MRAVRMAAAMVVVAGVWGSLWMAMQVAQADEVWRKGWRA